jgi:Methyltransferase domain
MIFNADDTVGLLETSEIYEGSIEQRCMPLSPSLFSPGGAWQKNNGSYWSSTKLSKLSFRTDALGVGITLIKHPWSGFAEILVDGNSIAVLDLFQEAGSMQHWYPMHFGRGSHSVELVVCGAKNPRSHDCQVHVVELEILEKTATFPSSYRYDSRNRGNPYPECFDQLLRDTSTDGLVLDCGSGDRNHPDSRVVSFEYSRFQGPDVFGDGHQLPFKENSFDLVLSQAVFEHVANPFVAASEIFRVLKPRGRVYVESAFMQPLHAVPYHFFNTTAWGLERLFSEFVIQEITHQGVLAQTLEWFYRLTELRQKGFGAKVDQVLSLARELDENITREELKSFSSYVTLLAYKPG